MNAKIKARSQTASRLLGILGAAFALILVLLPVHAFFSTWFGSVFGDLLIWKSWKEILLLAMLPLVIWLCVIRPDITKAMWKNDLNKLIAAYVVLNIIMALFSSASVGATIAGLLMNLRFLAMFVLAEIFVVANPPWLEKAKEYLTKWLLATAVFLSVLAILQVTVIPKDFLANFGYNKDMTIAPYLVVDQNPSAMRAFATLRGPNTLAAYLLLPLALALYIWLQDRRKWWALAIGGLVIVALALTHSRAGWLGALLMALTLAWAMLPRAKLIKWLKILALPLVLVGALVIWLAITVPAVRLVVFHSGGNTQDESLLEGSSELHVQYTLDGIAQILKNPLGTGVGVSGPASYYNTNSAPVIPEDYYVQIGQETGIIGLAAFIWICWVMARRLYEPGQMWPLVLLASFVGLCLIGVFMHVWADDPTAMTWWGLAGLFIASRRPRKYN